jgi:CrcB protein
MLATLGGDYPWGTLTVNFAGSFLLAAALQFAANGAWISPTACTVLATGVLGGFTTYSSFNQETFEALQRCEYARAGGYVALMLIVCLAGGYAGHVLARALVPDGG